MKYVLIIGLCVFAGLLHAPEAGAVSNDVSDAHGGNTPMKDGETTSSSGSMVPGGVVHELPHDLRDALVADGKVLRLWRDLTPLARNEWICWIESAKKAETRNSRIVRMWEELKAGKRRPCCWPGCPHRTKR